MPAKFTPPQSNFLSEEERQEWCDGKKPFYITGVDEGTGKYGLGYTYTLSPVDAVTGELVGESFFMTLLHNARRREQFEWTRNVLLENPDGIGPVVLEQVPTSFGNPAWVFRAFEIDVSKLSKKNA